MILNTELNSKNRITATNTLAIPGITYSFNIADWNLNEVKRLGIKVRKMITIHSMYYPKTDIYRLYIPRSNKGKGLTQLFYKTWTIGLFQYLNLLDDLMLEVALKHEKEKGSSHSVVQEPREFACEINLDLETEFDGEMNNKENT